jgi:hypothetical protein
MPVFLCGECGIEYGTLEWHGRLAECWVMEQGLAVRCPKVEPPIPSQVLDCGAGESEPPESQSSTAATTGAWLV